MEEAEMSQPYIGEVRLFAGNFAPDQWALCNGQALAISEFSTLYTLIGTTYGGDGVQSFNLPDLRGRVAVHQGNYNGTVYTLGQNGGLETVTLTGAQMPPHNHGLRGSSAGGTLSPAGAWPGLVAAASGNAATTLYGTGSGNMTTLAPTSVPPSPPALPHDNRQPYLALNYIIALYGIYPSPT